MSVHGNVSKTKSILNEIVEEVQDSIAQKIGENYDLPEMKNAIKNKADKADVDDLSDRVDKYEERISELEGNGGGGGAVSNVLDLQQTLFGMSHSFDEVRKAFEDGMIVRCRYSNHLYYAVYADENAVRFMSGDPIDESVHEDYTVSYVVYNSNEKLAFMNVVEKHATKDELKDKEDKWKTVHIEVDTEYDPGCAFIDTLNGNIEYIIKNDEDSDNLTYLSVDLNNLYDGQYAVVNFWSGTTPPTMGFSFDTYFMGKDVDENGGFNPQPNTYYTMIFHSDGRGVSVSVGGYAI